MRAPVARFVGVVAAIAVVLLLVAWTGAAAPPLDAQPVGEGTEQGGHVGYLLAWIENRGSLPVDIRDIGWSSDGLPDAEVLVGPLDGSASAARRFEPFRLPGGQRRAVYLYGPLVCPLPGDVVSVGTDPLVVVAKPAAGPQRTLTFALGADGQGMARTLPCPPR